MPTASTDPAYPWTPDDGNGSYINPIIFADYSDPDVIRVGDDFWLTASSFNCTPGLPILHSRDLVNWTIVGHALKNLPDPSYANVRAGCGVWAPAIRFHAEKFWIFFPTPDEGLYVITAADPRGPWTDPHMLQAGKGLIDPCPLWDEDGKAYLIFAYAGSRAGIKHRLVIREMDPEGRHLTGPVHTIFHDPENHPTAEGPKFHKRGDWYYVFAPAGGWSSGWQLVLRSKHVLGPYEHRIVMAQGETEINGPHQGALVDTPGGDEWFIHFQERPPYGRIVHLQPVTWTDGWPLIGKPSKKAGVGEPVASALKPIMLPGATSIPATSDSFDSSALGKQWQWHANHSDDWHSLNARPGWLRLAAMPMHPTDISHTPHLLLQKFPAPKFKVRTRVELVESDSSGGIAIVGRESAAWLFHHENKNCRVALRIGSSEVFSMPVPHAAIDLSVVVHTGGECSFFCLADGKEFTVPQTFQSTGGVWIGAKIGLVAISQNARGYAEFNHFTFEPV